VIRGIAIETDCVIKLKEKVKMLSDGILDLARVIPSASSDNPKQE